MDSVTHIVLGAAMGQAALSKTLGRPALILGAVLQTLPDLDVLVPHANVIAEMTEHRTWTHSIWVMLMLSPLAAWIIQRIFKQPLNYWRVLSLVLACWFGHTLLDACTTYGTQLGWPFSRLAVAWSNLFIIDPLYTLPLLISFIWVLRFSKAAPARAHLANILGLVISSLYLGWTLLAHHYVEQVVQKALQQPQMPLASRVLILPTPFNSVLWRVLLQTDNDQYCESFYSLLDQHPNLIFDCYPQGRDLLAQVQSYPEVQRLLEFNQGWVSTREQNGELQITDLRMGMEPTYYFSFVVARIEQRRVKKIEPQQLTMPRDWSKLSWIWQRMLRV